jgi:hypothetical protein
MFNIEKPKSATWEDWKAWRVYAKNKYPVKYFLSETLPRYFRVKKMVYIERPIYWFKSFIVRKDHKLDLRCEIMYSEFGEIGKYKWGFVRPSEKILAATFVVLDNFVKSFEKNGSFEDYISAFNIESEYDRIYLEKLKKILEIHKFFKEEYKNLNDYNSYNKIINEKLSELMLVRDILD